MSNTHLPPPPQPGDGRASSLADSFLASLSPLQPVAERETRQVLPTPVPLKLDGTPEVPLSSSNVTTLAVVRLSIAKPCKHSVRYDADGDVKDVLQSVYVPYKTLGEGKPPHQIEVVIRRVR